MLYCWSVHSDSPEYTLHKGGSKATWDSHVHLFKIKQPPQRNEKSKEEGERKLRLNLKITFLKNKDHVYQRKQISNMEQIHLK